VALGGHRPLEVAKVLDANSVNLYMRMSRALQSFIRTSPNLTPSAMEYIHEMSFFMAALQFRARLKALHRPAHVDVS